MINLNLIKNKIRIYKQSGDELICHCPFHEDSNPSFSLNIKSGKWICFAGCGSGNFSTLLQRLKIENKINLKIKEIKLDNPYNIKRNGLPKDFRIIKNENEIPDFIKQKDFTLEILQKFQIGFSKDIEWEDYLIIPIKENNKLITFQGRHILEDGKPKYKNPKNSDIHKTFFNYDIKRKNSLIFLVEGIFDAIKLFQWGLYGIASFGTSLSLRQKLLLTQLNPKKLFICYDLDKAGINGAQKILKDFSKIFKIYYVRLPKNKDIDNLTKNEFIKIIKTANKNY